MCRCVNNVLLIVCTIDKIMLCSVVKTIVVQCVLLFKQCDIAKQCALVKKIVLLLKQYAIAEQYSVILNQCTVFNNMCSLYNVTILHFKILVLLNPQPYIYYIYNKTM